MKTTREISSRRHVLVTGGLGYVGSHTAVQLMRAGHEVSILDNLSNSEKSVVDRIAQLGGSMPTLDIGDIRDATRLARLFRRRKVHAVVHCAGVKAVGESVDKPLDYYDVNVGGSVILFKAMAQANVMALVFSSSATVYGEPQSVPLHESHPRSPTSPYGRTKNIVELTLEDLHASDPAWSIAVLRYFNPAGAHPSGAIGENPRGIPNNLFPFISQVAGGARAALQIFGMDYDTDDGTCVRDYIHVMDLADAHERAVGAILGNPGYRVVNLGTGGGHSVLDVVRAYEKACGFSIHCRKAPRRAGDVPAYFADASRAETWLDWKATRGLQTMCEDAWRFYRTHMLAARDTTARVDITARASTSAG